MISLALISSAVLLQSIPSPDAMAKLRQGEVLTSEERKPGANGNFAVASVLIEAPPAKVWDVVADCARYSKTMPKIVASEAYDVKVSEGFLSGTMKCKVTTDLPWPFSDLTGETEVRFNVEPNGRYRRDWNLIGGDYEYMEGSWELQAVDEGTRTIATYRIRVKPKVALPPSLVKTAQVKSIPDMMRGLRNRQWAKR